jgi:hypothetical protein
MFAITTVIDVCCTRISGQQQQKKLGYLSEEAKAELIAQLASDPQAVSLMREAVSQGEATGSGLGAMGSASDKQRTVYIDSCYFAFIPSVDNDTETYHKWLFAVGLHVCCAILH